MVDHLYHGSPSRELAPPASCDAECSSRLLAERSSLVPNPTGEAKERAAATRRELLVARENTQLVPPKAQWIGKAVRLTGGAAIAWELGMAAKKMWFGVEAPPPSVDIVSAQLVSAGQVLAYGWAESSGYWEVTAPTLGWVGLDAAGAVVGSMIYDHHPGATWPPPPCVPWSQPGLSYPGWQILKGPLDDATVDCGTILTHYETPFKPLYPVASDGSFPGAFEPFTGQTVTESPPIEFWTSPWNLPGVRSNVVQEIENHPSRYPRVRLLEAHLERPEDFPHPDVPFTENENNHRCDLSGPALQNPGGNDDPPPFTLKIATPFPTLGRPAGAESAPDPYLRWGRTRWLGDYLDNFGDWGWRHIQAKHGWSQDDELATRSALQTPVLPPNELGPGVMEYLGAQYERNGAICRRRVVVEYNVDTVSGEPYGIRTSHGRYLGEAP